MLINSIELLKKARKKKYAIGAFNAYDMESAQAIIWAAEKVGKSVIVQMTEKSLEFAGFDTLSSIVFELAQNAKIPVITHLDHGSNINIIKKAISSSKFTSVMFDGSKLSLDENKQKTKLVVELAHKSGVAVEAELGTVPTNSSDDVITGYKTDANEAMEFVEETGCDSLAVAFGNVHGEKTSSEKLDFDVLKSIGEKVSIPLVFHGASNSTESEYKKAIACGIAKINIDTQLRQAFTQSIKQKQTQKDPRVILDATRDKMQKVVEDCIHAFGTK